WCKTRCLEKWKDRRTRQRIQMTHCLRKSRKWKTHWIWK
ncbi:hypothetical protein V3C99_004825, partial [Haemonchus contortus]